MAYGLGILKGMGVAFRNLMRGPITVQYPDERIELPERARWAVIPLYDRDGKLKCTACTNCVRACPDGILDLAITTREDKTKHIDAFTYELGACMMCGLCVEACPFDALAMGHDYELATADVTGLTTTLVADTDAASVKRDKPGADQPSADQPSGDAPAAPAPEGGAE